MQIKEEAIDNPINNVSAYNVIELLRELYKEKSPFILDRLSTYTRRALTIGFDDLNIEMTEDRNIQQHHNVDINNIFTSGVLNPAPFILFGNKTLFPYNFIEYKIPQNINDLDLSKNSEKLYKHILKSRKQSIKWGTGKVSYAKKYIYI